MTTSMIALAFLCLLYGLFWNNRPARSYPSATRQRGAVLPGRGLTAPTSNPRATRTGVLPGLDTNLPAGDNDRRAGDTTPYLRAIQTDHQAQHSVS